MMCQTFLLRERESGGELGQLDFLFHVPENRVRVLELGYYILVQYAPLPSRIRILMDAPGLWIVADRDLEAEVESESVAKRATLQRGDADPTMLTASTTVGCNAVSPLDVLGRVKSTNTLVAMIRVAFWLSFPRVRDIHFSSTMSIRIHSR